jgi:hypothetical protein
MIGKVFIVSIAMVVFMVVPSWGKPIDCKKADFYGSYIRTELNQDVFGDGSAVRNFLYQLNLQSDGTATQYWTGVNDFVVTLGTGSPWKGSWTCRSDGKLIVTLLVANYYPVTGNPNVTSADVELREYFRTTYLFSVDDENTLTQIQARTRAYHANQDPTDPTAGKLGKLSTATLIYKKLIASDADLLLP